MNFLVTALFTFLAYDGVQQFKDSGDWLPLAGIIFLIVMVLLSEIFPGTQNKKHK